MFQTCGPSSSTPKAVAENIRRGIHASERAEKHGSEMMMDTMISKETCVLRGGQASLKCDGGVLFRNPRKNRSYDRPRDYRSSPQTVPKQSTGCRGGIQMLLDRHDVHHVPPSSN